MNKCPPLYNFVHFIAHVEMKCLDREPAPCLTEQFNQLDRLCGHWAVCYQSNDKLDNRNLVVWPWIWVNLPARMPGCVIMWAAELGSRLGPAWLPLSLDTGGSSSFESLSSSFSTAATQTTIHSFSRIVGNLQTSAEQDLLFLHSSYCTAFIRKPSTSPYCLREWLKILMTENKLIKNVLILPIKESNLASQWVKFFLLSSWNYSLNLSQAHVHTDTLTLLHNAHMHAHTFSLLECCTYYWCWSWEFLPLVQMYCGVVDAM